MGKISESYKEEIEQIFGEIYEDFIKKKLLDSIHIFILKESEKIKNDFVQFILDFAQNWDHKVLKMIESTLSEEIDPIKTSIEENSKNIFSGVNRLEKIVMGHKKEIEDEISRNRSECMEKLHNVSELLTNKTNDLSAQMSSLDIKLVDLDAKLISMGEGLNETLIQNRRYLENQMPNILNSYKRLQKILNILTPLVIFSFILNILTLILIMVKFF